MITTKEQLLALADEAGNICTDQNVNIDGYLYVEGNLYVVGNLYVAGDLDVRDNLEVVGNLDVRGNLEVVGDLDVKGDLYWSNASMPSVVGTMTHARVCPPSWQRSHWQRRLGIDLGNACCEKLGHVLEPHLPELLAKDCWSDTERWILNSWALTPKEM